MPRRFYLFIIIYTELFIANTKIKYPLNDDGTIKSDIAYDVRHWKLLDSILMYKPVHVPMPDVKLFVFSQIPEIQEKL